MHGAEIRNRFIELRAQGWSLQRIAAELHVAKRTLVDWNRDAQHEIRGLKDLELEALHERILVSHEEELTRLTAQLNRIETVLAKRNLDCLSTESLFVLAATVRAQLRRLTNSAPKVWEGQSSGAAPHGEVSQTPPPPTESLANGVAA
jgi:hypothetical protein